eukprot:scaffold3686_cov106-Skeletonema_dohrnii-CCMP3373.AAC.1
MHGLLQIASRPLSHMRASSCLLYQSERVSNMLRNRKNQYQYQYSWNSDCAIASNQRRVNPFITGDTDCVQRADSSGFDTCTLTLVSVPVTPPCHLGGLEKLHATDLVLCLQGHGLYEHVFLRQNILHVKVMLKVVAIGSFIQRISIVGVFSHQRCA